MSDVRVTINGQDYSAQPGQTILQVCWANRIYVPTLCHYKGLKDIGACRLCIVEIQGQRRPVPACTTPVGHEMVVSTSTPLLEDLRRQTLELIFGERNHICPFCPRSGHCELQTAAYKHNMDHVRYDYLFPQLPVDSSHLRIAMDHNRCILCSRCIRACDQWVGAHVLDLNHRGAAAMVIADSGVPLGQSSCVSCGTCVAVCPTGALFEKRSAHWQGRLPLQLTETICPSCGVGCRVNASVRHRQIGSIVSAGGPAGNRILCYRGRFDLVNPTRGRVEAIQMKRGTQWVQRSLDDVLRECAVRLSSAPIHADPNRVIGLLSPRLPLETLAAVQGFITKVVGSSRWTIVDRSDAVGMNEALDLDGRVAPLAGLSDLDEADMYLLLGCHLERSHGVVASYVRRGILHRRAKLVKVNPRHTWLTDWTDLNVSVERGKDVAFLAAMLKYLWEMGKAQLTLTPEMEQKLKALDDADVTRAVGVPAADIRKAAEMYANASNPMILCGRGITRRGSAGVIGAMNIVKACKQKTSQGRWRLVELAMGANSAGARLLGAVGTDIRMLEPQSADVAFVVLGDEDPTWERDWMERLRTVSFVVAMIARDHDVKDIAHVVIPTAAWAERQGTYVNFEGRMQKSARLMESPPYVVDEVDFFEKLAKTWQGPGCAWSAPGVPDVVRNLADGHMVPSQPKERPVDLAGLEALVAS